MKRQPYVCPVAFGPKGVEALRIWLDFWDRAGSELKYAPITTPGSATEVHYLCLDEYPEGYAGALVVDRDPPEAAGHPQHRAGWLKLAARACIDRPVLACDCDLVFLRDPQELVGDLLAADPYHTLALAPDPWPRTYDWWPELGQEMNTGLIWCDSAYACDRYLEIWREHDCPELRKLPWADEVVTTGMWREIEGDAIAAATIDQTWNYCHGYVRDNKPLTNPATFHGHGQAGKTKLRALHERLLAGEL